MSSMVRVHKVNRAFLYYLWLGGESKSDSEISYIMQSTYYPIATLAINCDTSG